MRLLLLWLGVLLLLQIKHCNSSGRTVIIMRLLSLLLLLMMMLLLMVWELLMMMLLLCGCCEICCRLKMLCCWRSGRHKGRQMSTSKLMGGQQLLRM